YTPVEMGLLITPWPIAVAFAAPLAGRLMERYPAGLLGGIGLLLFAIGLATLALLPADPPLADVIWRMALSGFGFGLFQTPNNRTMIAAAPRERSGGASGMLGTARLLGETVGAALVSLLIGRFALDGSRIALLVGVGFAVTGAALSALRLSEAGARGAERVRVTEDARMKADCAARPVSGGLYKFVGRSQILLQRYLAAAVHNRFLRSSKKETTLWASSTTGCRSSIR